MSYQYSTASVQQGIVWGKFGRRTLSGLECPHVALQLVQSLDVLVLLHTVEDDPTSRLEIRDSVLERHGANRDTGVHLVLGEVETADSAGVDASPLLLELVDELNGLDFRGTGYGAGREYRSKCVEPARGRDQD